MIAALALFALTPDASAAERQFRDLRLADGRQITAEILSTTPKGLELQLPQGPLLLSYELLVDMAPTNQAAYDAQKPWVVYVDVPDVVERDLLELVRAIPNLSVHEAGGSPPGGLTPLAAVTAAQCERKAECIVDAVSGAPWMWVLTAEQDPSGGLTFHSKVSTSGDLPHEVSAPGLTRDELWGPLHQALGLGAPTAPAPKATSSKSNTPKSAGVFDEKKVIALSFVPVPGMPSLAQKDGAGAALAFGVVVPSTALWVGAVGNSGQSAPEFLGLSVVGYYAVTVLANQVTGFRSLERGRLAVGAAPARGGGTVTVAGGF